MHAEKRMSMKEAKLPLLDATLPFLEAALTVTCRGAGQADLQPQRAGGLPREIKAECSALVVFVCCVFALLHCGTLGIVLRPCYERCGTDSAYGGTRM
eukprot:2664579-Rhodomonas_salina.1